MADARKSLDVLCDEWSDCVECDLGIRRRLVNGRFVFGEGQREGIMFIGEGPGATEENEGRPFVGESGRKVLRKVLTKMQFTNYYIANCVACRSAGPAYNSEGQPIVRVNKNGESVPFITDKNPSPAQIKACLPRLYEQIYLVDPVLIVALGVEAASTLKGKPVQITKEHGKTQPIEIPGAWHIPVVTEKKQQWFRKVHGQWMSPTELNTVKYLMIPMLHPAYVLRNHADRRPGNALSLFLKDMAKAISTYNRYQLEVYGIRAQQELELREEDIEFREPEL